MDRTIHFGDDAADARYRIQDTSSTGGDLVLAEDLDGGTVLLEYDYSASEWVSRGPVNLSGNDITNAGSISADTLEADKLKTGRSWQTVTSSRSLSTTETNDTGSEILIAVNIEVTSDGTDVQFDLEIDGVTRLKSDRLVSASTGDRLSLSLTIPAGSSYTVNPVFNATDFALQRWEEHRP
jgi:hypothetical protein